LNGSLGHKNLLHAFLQQPRWGADRLLELPVPFGNDSEHTRLLRLLLHQFVHLRLASPLCHRGG